MAKSTLTILLDTIRQQAESPTIAEIQKYLTVVESGRDNEEDLEDLPGIWHPSDLCYGFCPRQRSIHRYFEEEEAPRQVDPGLLRIFWLGTAAHSMYQNRILGPSGLLYGWWLSLDGRAAIADWRARTSGQRPPWLEVFAHLQLDGFLVEGFMPGPSWEYREPAVYWPEYDIGGHIDGICTPVPWELIPDRMYILDVKTINERGFSFLQEPRPYHVAQVQLYMHADLRWLDIPTPARASILYVNKNTSSEREFLVDKDRSTIDSVTSGITQYNEALSSRRLPPRVEACKSERSKQAKACTVSSECFAATCVEDLLALGAPNV